jgi:arylamine N-acetyltransferase
VSIFEGCPRRSIVGGGGYGDGVTASVDVAGYLRRLGIKDPAGPPCAASLRRLHAAHVERVPYECLEIALERPTTVDPAESARRVIGGRGGYCFHLNGAFSLLLRGLGYQVTRHVGGVQGAEGGSAGATGNHLVLTVSGLPSPECPGGVWLVDAGLGDALHEPLPLAEGVYRQGPFTYRLRPSEVEPGGWRFDHDPRGSFFGMDFRPEPAQMSRFATMHQHLSTSPDSGFVKVTCAQRRDASGADTVRGLVLTRVGSNERTVILETPGDYFEALADVFGLTLADVGADDRSRLWDRLSASHELWLTGQTA